MTRALVVDDEARMRRVLKILLEHMGVETLLAESGDAALECFCPGKFDLILTDVKMPGMSGVDLLARIGAVDPDVPVILLTAYGTVQAAVDAMKQGAFDYILKPFDVQAIEAIIRNALALRRSRAETRALQEPAASPRAFQALADESAALREVQGTTCPVGTATSAVPITGEIRAAKEVLWATDGPPEPEGKPDSFQLDAAVQEVERNAIRRALKAANDNKAEAARLLGICERTLWYKLKRYSL
jgi:DNA-binding NtrC family response regulator